MNKIPPPNLTELDEYYQSYWNLLSEEDLLAVLQNQLNSFSVFINTIPASKETFRYAENKWMVKEVVGHLIDAERILAYRALRFSRNDKTELPGFEENEYMIESNFRSRSLSDILNEWKTVRNASISFFSSIDPNALDRKGMANENEVTPRIILYFIIVHTRHHQQIIIDRYLSGVTVS